MTPETLFPIQLVFGYIAWLLCFGTYFWPRLKMMDRADAHRVIAISFAVEADEQCKQMLRRWRDQCARIVSSFAATRTIADSILNTPFPSSVRPTLLGRSASWFIRQADRNSAFAEGLTTDSARAPQQGR